MQSKTLTSRPIRKEREKAFPITLRVTERQYFKLVGVLCDAVECHEWDSDYNTILREALKN